MKIAIIAKIIGPSLEELQEAAQKRGFTLDLIQVPAINLSNFNKEQFVETLAQYDVVYHRTGMKDELLHELYYVLEMRGVPVINHLSRHPFHASKMGTALLANRYRIPHPKTMYADVPTYDDIAAELGDVFVAKPNEGSHGENIVKITSKEDFSRESENFQRQRFVFQEFIESDAEYRVYSVEGRGVAAYKKVPLEKTDEFRKNSNFGTEAKPFDPEKKRGLLEIAGNVGRHFGVDIAGIDILEKDNNYILLEVNSQPRWAGFAKGMQANMNEIVLDYLHQVAYPSLGTRAKKWFGV